jgi:Na+/H+-translocating membrane pyrophosphatase
VFISVIAAIIWACVDRFGSPYTTFSFFIGAVTSMACGAFGMHIATLSNFRTTICAKISLGSAFRLAYRAGVVIGFALVSVSLIILLILISVYQKILGLEDSSKSANYYNFLF